MSELPLNADDPFLPCLRAVIDRNFPEVELLQDPLDPVAHPIMFHDRHLASQLTLKHVRIVPTLAESLADYCTHVLDEFVRNGYNFDHTKYVSVSRRVTQEPMREAFSVGSGYADIFGAASAQLATKILLTPDIPEWSRLLVFVPADLDIPPGKEFFANGRLVVNMREPAPDSSKPARRDALDLHSVYQWLASWSFYSLIKQGEKVISLMSSMSQFDWETAHTTGLLTLAHLPIPPDAVEGFAPVQIEEYLAGRRKTMERRDPNQPWSKKQSIKVPRQRKSQKYSPAPKDYIQKVRYIHQSSMRILIPNCLGMVHRRQRRHDFPHLQLWLT
jgi:hypothetical protein